MSPPDLTDCKLDPTLLDKLCIDNGNGKPMAMFGLGGELFVAPRERTQLREDMLQVQEDYFQTFSENLDQLRFESAREPDGQILNITGNPFPMVRESIGEWPKDQPYTNVVFKRFKHPSYPRRNDSITPWVGRLLVEAETDKHRRLSCYGFNLPVTRNGVATNFHAMRAGLLRWCAIVRPAHGLAGFSIVFEVGSISGEPYAHSTFQRYPGFDFSEITAFASEARSVHNRIKSVNWLTILGHDVLHELGGRSSAKNALGSECEIYDYEGGIVIQAGEAPRLGDTYTGDIPELYKRVSDFTKPVRFEAYRSSLFRVCKPLIGAEEAVRWVRRFD